MGEPEDIAGECNAHLHIGDNYGDNHATMRCQLEAGHQGDHQETWRGGTAVVRWSGCDKETDE